MDLHSYLKKKKVFVDTFLKKYLSSNNAGSSCPRPLHRSMAYSLMAGGKRLRPILAIASCEASGGRPEKILPAASSLELIHTYSLIHDDLPSMDNDDFRRNKPTNHKVFGEAVAILAGDALLTDALGMITKMNAKPEIIIKIIREVTAACGSEGMVGGQTADILFEDRKIRKKDLLYIHTHKTGALIRASVRIGAITAEAAPGKLRALSAFGDKIGLAFQIVDDILDVVGTKEELGKSTGADTNRGKNTYPSLFGIEKSREKAEDLIEESLDAIKNFDKKADTLREISQYILKRRS